MARWITVTALGLDHPNYGLKVTSRELAGKNHGSSYGPSRELSDPGKRIRLEPRSS